MRQIIPRLNVNEILEERVISRTVRTNQPLIPFSANLQPGRNNIGPNGKTKSFDRVQGVPHICHRRTSAHDMA